MSNRRTRDPFEPERPKRRSRRQRQQNDEEPQQVSKPRRRRLPIVLLAVLVIVLLLPNIIGWLGLQKHAISYALGDFQGKVEVGSASLGWFQRIQLRDVVATNLAGSELATIEKVQTSKPLYAFLIGSDYGEVEIHKPVVFLHLRPDGSNLEDAISRYLADAQPSPMDPNESPHEPFVLPKMMVRVHDGAAVLTTESDPETWQIDSLAAVATLSQPDAPLAATAQFRAMSLQADESGQLAVKETGTVLIKSAFDNQSNQLTFSTANVELESDQFPLSIVGPLSQRFIGPATFGGSVSSNVIASWNSATNEIVTEVQSLQISNAQVFAPQLLNQDNFYLDQISAGGAIQLSSNRIAANQFSIETDFGKLTANGQFDPGQLALLSNQSQLPETDLQLEGQLDIAKLMQRLPSTFQLHKDVVIESGTIQFSAGQNNRADARRLVMNVDTANIRATRGSQPIVWQQPLRIVGVLSERNGQFAIERLECISDFLNVEGSATIREGMFSAKGNLGELSQRIRQFADLGELDFSGMIDGQFGWEVIADGEINVAQLSNQPIQIGGEFKVREPVIQFPGLAKWSPREAIIRTSGKGQMTQLSDASTLALSQAGAQLIIDGETSTVSLARPVEDAFTNQQWVFNTQVTGQLAGWMKHIRNFVDPGDFEMAGDLNFAGITVLDPNEIRIEKGQYEVKQLGFDGYGASVREDRVVGLLTAGYSLTSGDINVSQASLQGSGMSATAQNLKLTTANALQLNGSAAWRSDINRLAQWLSLSPQPDSINWYGAVEGTVDFNSTAKGTAATFQADVTDLVATQRATPQQPESTMQMVGSQQRAWVELWNERSVKLSGQMNLSHDFDTVNFQQLGARSRSLDIDATGSISELSGAFVTNLEGSYRPDFEKINSLLSAYTQEMVQLSGEAIQPFRIQGPLFATGSAEAWVPQGLIVQAMIGWDEGQLVGLPIGKSEVRLDLQNQVAAMQSANIPISGGTAVLQPQLDMRTGDPLLIHGQAKILNSVQVTPEICSECLKFVAPWLADTTNAQGVFSAELQGLNMPINDPMGLSARGTLLVEELTVESGPLADQLLGTVTQIQALLKPDTRERQLKKWLRVERQAIPVAVENRRVYHEGVKFSHNELVIRTSGSVGIEDQSVDMVAKIPIADEWIEGNRYLAGLKGQSLSIPIGGTVDRPIIDRGKVNQLSQELVRNAAQGAIGNAITDKVNPKLNEFNSKVTGEVNKLQDKFQNKLGGFLNDKLGLPSGDQGQANPQQPSSPAKNPLEDRLNGQLQNGLNRLFGK